MKYKNTCKLSLCLLDFFFFFGSGVSVAIFEVFLCMTEYVIKYVLGCSAKVLPRNGKWRYKYLRKKKINLRVLNWK